MSDKAEQQSASSGMDVGLWVVVSALVAGAVIGNSYYAEVSPLYRAIGVVVVAAIAAFFALQTSQGKSFNQLRKDAMVEMRKVTWPTRQETLQTTLVVVLFVAIVALILFLMDWVLNGLVSWFIG